MFDFAWSEFALIGIVAMILIGPKDMPAAIRAVKDVVRKARSMAAEFQTHVDDMVREADLKEVRDSINEIRNFDLQAEIERSVDADGTIREALSTDPLAQHATPIGDGAAVEEAGAVAIAEPPAEPEPPPGFIPPQIIEPEEPPFFLPPDAYRPEGRT